MWLVFFMLAIYLLVMVFIGVYLKNKATDAENYYLAGRSLPWPVIALTFAATWIGASATLEKSGIAYNQGFGAMSTTVASIVAFLIFTLFAGRIRRIGANHGVTSIPNLILKRFGKVPSIIAAVISAWTLMSIVGTQMIATTGILKMLLSSLHVTYEGILIVSMLVMILYTMFSGLFGDAITDVIQGTILLIVIGVVLPVICLNHAGGISGLKASVPASFFSMKLDDTMIGYTVSSFLYFMSGPPYWQRAFAAKSSAAATRGAIGGNVMILFYGIMVTLIGICAVKLYPVFPEGISPEMVIPLMVQEKLSPMVFAITMTALLAVIMSTVDSYLLLAAQTLTMDIYGCLRPSEKPEKLMILGRVAVAVVGVGAVLFALELESIFQAMVFSLTYYSAALAVPCLAALLSKKVTKQGIVAGMLFGIIGAFTWKALLHTPWGISEAIFGAVSSLAALTLVSALTGQAKEPAVFFE